MAHATRVCILSHSVADAHRATDKKPPCDSHSHCSVDTALELVADSKAEWTNGNRSAIQMADAPRKWAPRLSDGYSVLQLVTE